MISTEERSQIHDWCVKHNVKDFMISDDGVIDVTTTELTTIKDCTRLPFKFGTVAGAFKVAGDVDSLENLPHTVGGSLSLYESQIVDFTGVNKIVKQIAGTFVAKIDIVNVLGLIQIKGVVAVDSDRGKIDEILNKHLPTRDTIAAQDEFLEAGMKAQARS